MGIPIYHLTLSKVWSVRWFQRFVNQHEPMKHCSKNKFPNCGVHMTIKKRVRDLSNSIISEVKNHHKKEMLTSYLVCYEKGTCFISNRRPGRKGESGKWVVWCSHKSVILKLIYEFWFIFLSFVFFLVLSF